MLFRMLKVRRMVGEARKDPAGFAAREAAGAFVGLFLVPAIVAALALVLFFLLGYTTLLGGPMGFFKVLFWIGLIVGYLAYAILRPVIRALRRGTRAAVERGRKIVENELQ